MKRKYELVIFDLDGTLLDTSQGIFNSVRYAENKMGLRPVSDDVLRTFLGPPPQKMYSKIYGLNEKEAFMAAKLHREYGLKKAINEAVVYPNILDTLNFIGEEGYKLAVATLKSQNIAEKILSNYELLGYFDCVVGMDAYESMTKEQTISKAVLDTETKGEAVMVGDSIIDMIGAELAGADFIGALYGFGFSEPVDSKWHFIKDISELKKML